MAACAAYSIFYPNFASFRGQRGMYLEDIYISPDYRGRGIGEAMLREIARIAAAHGFERIDFQVLDWNKPAIDFYESTAPCVTTSNDISSSPIRLFADLAK